MELEMPLASDCCGSGCTPCVFDIYEERLRKLDGKQAGKSEEPCDVRTDLLSETRFKPFKIIEKHQLTDDVFRFRFQPIEDLSTKQNKLEEIIGVLPYKIGQHLFLRCYLKTFDKNNGDDKDNENNLLEETTESYSARSCVSENKMVTRAYTPITVAANEKHCCFDIFAKLYKNGVASEYFNKSVIGDILYWRGPSGVFQYKQNTFNYILLLCVGSGLAPMIPIVSSILSNELDETQVHLMYGIKNINNIILRNDLRLNVQYWNFSMEYFFSEEMESNKNVKFGENMRQNRIDALSLSEYCKGKNLNRLLVLMCGTDKFISDMKINISDLGVDIETNVHVF